MQNPLFWLDLGPYNAQLTAIAEQGRLKALAVETPADPPADLTRGLQSAGFRPDNGSDTASRWSLPARDDRHVATLAQTLARADEVAFDPKMHLRLIGEPTPEPARNPVSQERTTTDTASETPVTPDVRPRRAPAADRDVIADTGVVHGFSIKELRGHGDALRRSVSRMTEEQQRTYLTKATLWPPINYHALAEAGVEPAAAHLIKLMRDNLCNRPGQLTNRRVLRRPPHPEVYAECVTTIRDAMMAVKTLDDAVEAVYGIMWHYAEVDPDSNLAWTSYQSPVTHDQDGEIIDSQNLRGTVRREPAFWQQPLWRPGDPRAEDKARQIRSEIEREGRRGTSSNTRWDFLPRNHALRTGRRRQLTDEQKKARREAERDKAPTRIPRTHLEHVKREGLPTWRERNENVDPHTLIRTFDLSGVEFGNWESQAERQALLNQTYDAFRDLTHTLGIDARAIGLGGRLGLAFGSRGKGGKRPAAAHYEPANVAINLTRMAGAGSLAHEWAHALDHTAALGMPVGRDAPMASDALVGQNLGRDKRARVRLGDHSTERLHAVVADLHYDANAWQDRRWEAVQRKGIRDLGHLVRMEVIDLPDLKLESRPVQDIYDEVSQSLADKHKAVLMSYEVPESAADEAVQAAMAAPYTGDHIDRAHAFDYAEYAEALVETCIQKLPDEDPGRLRRAFQDRLVQLIARRNGLAESMALVGGAKAEAETVSVPGLTDERQRELVNIEWDATIRTVPPMPSPMARTAREMDRDRSKPYWSRTHEMFARGFEAYLKATMETQGQRNDFLVSYGKPATLNGKTFESVYPQGQQLRRIMDDFNRFFAEITLEETESASPLNDTPGLLLYSLDGDRIETGVPDWIKAERAMDELDHMLGGMRVLWHDTMGTAQGYPIAGRYSRERDLGPVIRLALDHADPVSAAYHEGFHAASDQLMTPAERSAVRDSFAPGTVNYQRLEERLVHEGKGHLVQIIERSPDEAAAYGFQYWMNGRMQLDEGNRQGGGLVARTFAKIRDTLASVRDLVRGYGYRTAADIFRDLRDGALRERAVAARDASAPRAAAFAHRDTPKQHRETTLMD